jgi:hypothetical protein
MERDGESRLQSQLDMVLRLLNTHALCEASHAAALSYAKHLCERLADATEHLKMQSQTAR